MNDTRYKQTHAAVVRLLTALEVDQKDDNFKETPRRVATWLLAKFPSVEDQEVQRGLLAKATFPSNYDGIVAETGIKTYGLCPHHFKDVTYNVSVGYLVSGRMLGLSKLARLVEVELGVAITQEDGTFNLALSLGKLTRTDDVAVVVSGAHSCMTNRGVRQHGAVTHTSEMRGKFRSDQGGIKSEFLSLIGVSK